jgi:hypothetical protein
LCSLAAILGSEITPTRPALRIITDASRAAAVEQPKHPVHALTTFEISRYRRELENAIRGISPDAPVQADLKSRLAEVVAEQEQRAKAASRA